MKKPQDFSKGVLVQQSETYKFFLNQTRQFLEDIVEQRGVISNFFESDLKLLQRKNL
jgi:hypothetical protein